MLSLPPEEVSVQRDTPDACHGRPPLPPDDGLPAVVADAVALCRQIVEQSGDCIKVLDGAGRLLWMNGAGQRLLDICDFAPLVGQRWIDFWSGDSREAAERAFAAARGGGLGRFTGPCATMSGVVKWWNVVVSQLPSDDGAERLVSTSREVTEIVRLVEQQRELADAERAARAEAERARQCSDALLNNVSHDLRAPLNATLGWTKLLQAEPLSASAGEALDAIEDATVRQIEMVDQLLEAARAGSESLRLHLDTIDLAELTAEALRLLKTVTDARRLRIHLSAPETPAAVLADARQIHRAICNLLENAVKFTPRNGTIRVELVAGPSVVQLSVADSGAGLNGPSLSRVFDRFWTDGSAAERDEGGTGLGLAIVRSIAELHGGGVEVHSDGVGRGATFVMSLPLATGLRTPPAADSRETVDLAGISVVIAAPDGSGRAALTRMLQHAGASVVTAGSVAEAANAWGAGVDVVVIDDACGPEAVRQLIGQANVHSARPLVLGADPLTESDARTAECARMVKPVVGRDLARRVHRLARGPR